MTKNTKKNFFCSIIIIFLSFSWATKAFSLEIPNAQTQNTVEAGNTDGAENNSQPEETAASEKTTLHLDWIFITYDEPDFSAKRTGQYTPQDVVIFEANGEGWGRIEISGASHWVYYVKNIRRIEKFMSLYNNKGDAEPVDIIRPQLIEITAQEDNWVQVSTWLGLKWIDLNSFSTRVSLDVPIFNQRKLGYPTGCEIVSVGMMINYVVSADIDTLVSIMPRSSDPNYGFRGNPATMGGFTVFPPALLDLTAEYLDSSHDMSGCSMDDLKDKLSSDKPIVVWIVGFGFNVHAICLTGYDERGFYYNDPWTGRKDSFITYSSFFRIWDDPIFDSNFNKEYPPRKALSF